jgi:hypothetical protein
VSFAARDGSKKKERCGSRERIYSTCTVHICDAFNIVIVCHPKTKEKTRTKVRKNIIHTTN